MPAAGRLGDQCTGHGGFPPRPSTSAQSLVKVNGIPLLVVGSTFASHKSGKKSHGGTLAAGSTLAKIDGVPLARIGDPVACGSALAEGSDFVFYD